MREKRIKISTIFLASLLLLACAYSCAAQVGTSKPNGPVGSKDVPNKPPPKILPDLVIWSIKTDNLLSGKITVVVKNQGSQGAIRSDVHFKATSIHPSDPPIDITQAVPPIVISGKQTIIIELPVGLREVMYCVKADGLGNVEESNENNNQRCGKFKVKQ